MKFKKITILSSILALPLLINTAISDAATSNVEETNNIITQTQDKNFHENKKSQKDEKLSKGVSLSIYYDYNLGEAYPTSIYFEHWDNDLQCFVAGNMNTSDSYLIKDKKYLRVWYHGELTPKK